jgi:hypothetical protein
MAVWSCAATGFEVNRDDLHPAGELVSKALDLHLALEVGRVLRRLSLVPVDVIEKHGDPPSLTRVHRRHDASREPLERGQDLAHER